jgi:GntR family transcriptional regulator/MocR family aminotransferase
MKRTPASYLLPVTVQIRGTIPIYQQLYDWFRRAIASGQLRPGQRVPSTRNLAVELKISRMPVLGAFDQLLAEGYLETFVGAGTCVARSIPQETLQSVEERSWKGRHETGKKRGPRQRSLRGLALTQAPAQTWLENLGAFRVSLPALDHFREIGESSQHSAAKRIMAYGTAMGYLPFVR